MILKNTTVFDNYGAIYERRKAFLEDMLPQMITKYDLRTVLDVGCGVGFFSEVLATMGLQVRALDAREENINEAKRRYPEIPFFLYNVEDKEITDLGPSDLILCFGLLYHLENPFIAIRNLYALTEKIIFIESRVTPSPQPCARLLFEGRSEDQSIGYIALVPSESGMIHMLYSAGFKAVYRPVKQPEHPDFLSSLFEHRKRTILIASKIELDGLSLLKKPETTILNPWERRWWKHLGPLKRLKRRTSK